MKNRLINYFKASFPGIAIQTCEEARALGDIIEAAKAVKRGVITWSATEGMKIILPQPKVINETKDPVDALNQRHKDSIYIFRDLHLFPFGKDPLLTRALRDLLTWAPTEGSCVMLVGPEFKPHNTIEKTMVVLDYSLPSKDDLAKIAKGIAESVGKKIETGEDVIRALGGLSTHEAENALALSIIETNKFDPSVIYREKVQAVKKTGLLDIVEPDQKGLEAIGGLEELKEWILKRRRAYSPEAEKFGLPAPKGVLLVGVPGTGKSLSAKAIGTALGVPTVRLDIGNLFNSLVGESEARTRDALKLAEAMSPCVLWIDEIDKGFAGSSGSGSGDSGVTRRVFGTVISWMQERRRPVFLVATANQVGSLPPELLRKGRFDEIFAVDLPNSKEREMIFSIHITKKNRAIKDFDLKQLSNATDGFTGSEIENVIDEAMFNAFDKDREITSNDMIAAANATTPLSKTAKEQIDGIREWAKTRARFASTPEETTPTSTKRRLS